MDSTSGGHDTTCKLRTGLGQQHKLFLLQRQLQQVSKAGLFYSQYIALSFLLLFCTDVIAAFTAGWAAGRACTAGAAGCARCSRRGARGSARRSPAPSPAGTRQSRQQHQAQDLRPQMLSPQGGPLDNLINITMSGIFLARK